MFLKKKSIPVIILSSTLISLVLVITLVGFYLYLNWKEENNSNFYQGQLRELNAKLYEKYISISTVLIKIGEEGVFKGKPIVEGHIRNRSKWELTSLKLKISILDNENRVLHMDIFYPLNPKSYFGVISRKTGTYLAPNDSVSFKHLLENCPDDIYTYLKMRTKFAKEKKKDILNVNYKIEGLSLE